MKQEHSNKMRIKRFFLFVFFLSSTFIMEGRATPVGSCLRAFSMNEIQSFFAHPENIKKYVGQQGYLLFVEQSRLQSMDTVFQQVSKSLGQRFKLLHWKNFRGSTKEFQELRSSVLNERGDFKVQYLAMTGYVRLSDDFFAGNMKKAFENVSAVLNKAVFKSVQWQQFRGSTKEFQELRSSVLNERGYFKEEYRAMTGYARLSDKLFAGNMKRAFENVSAVLNKAVFKSAQWQQFQGSTKEFTELRSSVLNERGDFKEVYRTMTGYVRLSDDFFAGNMKKAFESISAIFSFAHTKELDWQSFYGTTTEYHHLVLFVKNTPLEDIRGLDGQKKVAQLIFNNHLRRAYDNVSSLRAVLFAQPAHFNVLKWSRSLKL